MATADISKEVSFKLFCGNLPITKVHVTVFQNDLEDSEKRTYSCVPTNVNGGKLWEVTANGLPTSRELWYLYEFEINNDCSTRIQEYYFRSLKPQNRNLCDVPTAHPKFKLSPSLIRTGIEYYLRNCFLKHLVVDEDSLPLQTVLYDLEHCWRFIRFDDFEPGEMKPIQDWTMRQLHIYSELDNSVVIVFFATVYGCVFSLNQSDMSNLSIDIDKTDLEIVRDSMAGIRRHDLTEWSLMHIKQTGLMVLWSLEQLHWLTVVAYLGKMYKDVDELLKAKQSVNRNKITIETVQNKVIPYLQHNFLGNNEAITKLLLEIPVGWGFTEDEKSQLVHLVQGSIPKEDLVEDPTSTRSDTKDTLIAIGADDVHENPKVQFSLWTGKLDVAKVTLTIYCQRQKDLLAIRTVDCQPTDPSGKACQPESRTEHDILWVANVDGLHRYGPYLQYRYECEIRHSGVRHVYKESNYRKLYSQNRVLQDNLNLRFLPTDKKTKMRDIIFEGLMFYLQSLADGSQFSFETAARDLEHMLQCREDISTQENVNCILDLAEGLIGSMLEDGNNDKLLLATIVYGVMLSLVDGETQRKQGRLLSFEPEQLRKIRNAIAAVHRDRLTKWCVPHIIRTGQAILWSLQTLHWLVVVAYFGRLHELDDLLETNKIQDTLNTVNRNRIPIDTVFNVVIPRILKYFGTDKEATTKLMLEIPSSFRFTREESDRMSQVVEANLPQQYSKVTLFQRNQEDADYHKEGNGAYEVRNGELCEAAKVSNEYQTPTRFRLCVNSKNKKVVAITLHMCSNEGKVGVKEKRKKLDIVMNFEGDKFSGSWTTAATDIFIQTKQHMPTIRYQYAIVYETNSFWAGPELLSDRERAWKSITPGGTAYDIYRHNRYDHHSKNVSTCNTCAIGTFVHVDEILRKMEAASENLLQALNELILVGFPGTRNISKEFANFFKNWLDIKLTKINNMQNGQQSHEWKQTAFLAILFGKVMKAKTAAEGFEPGSIERNNCIKLKEALSLCNCDDIPSSLHDEFEVVCIWLIKVLDDNWIFFWQQCSNIIGIGRIQELRRCVKAPNFSQNNAKEATEQVQSAISNLLNDKPDYSVALIVCVMEEIVNITILVDVLHQLSDSVRSVVENSEEVNDRASSRCEELLQVHKGNLKFMTDLWKDVKNLPIPGVVHVLRSLIDQYLKDKQWSASDPNIQILIPDKDIYVNGESVLRTMKTLLSSKTFCYQPYCPQKLFLKVIEESSILKLLEREELKNMIEQGIQSVSSCHHNCIRPHHNKKIQIAQQLQHGISSSDYLKGDELVLRANDLLDKLLKSVPLPDILKYVCKVTEKGCPEEDLAFLTRHINDQLGRKDIEEQTKVFTQVLRDNQIGGRLNVKSTSIASILQRQMDVVVEDIFSTGDIPSVTERVFPNFEANIQAILRYQGFWSMILEVACNSNHKFTDHCGFNTIVTLLTLLPQKLTDGEISIAFLKKILKRRTDVFMMLKLLPNESVADDKWQTICKSAEKRKDTFLMKRDFLRKLGDEEGYVADIARLAKVTDMKIFYKEVSTLFIDISEESTLFLCRTEDPAYWGKIIFPLTRHAIELIRLVDSETFCNVCRSFFEGNIPDLDDALAASTSESTKTSTMSTDGQPITLIKLIDMMQIHCLSIYRKYGLLFAKPDMDVSVALVSGLIEGIDDNDDMIRELSLMETVCGEKASTATTEAISSLIKLDDVSQKARQLQSVFETFSVTDENNTLMDALATLVHMPDRKTQERLTLGGVHNAVEKIDDINTKFDPNDCWAVVEQLISCKELIRFLRSVIDEDLRNLIDAVEERSDQNVNEQTVSALLDVQRFMSPLLKMTPSNRTGDFIDAISSNVSQAEDSKASDSLSMKINTCVHNVYSLEDLYKNVANRGEMTKEKIYNAMKFGVYEFQMSTEDDKCIAKLTYKREAKRTTCGLEELNDLRSRALLIVNSKKATDTSDTSSLSSPETQQLPNFVECVTTVNEIVQICNSLTNSGYFKFRKFERISGKDAQSLKNIREKLQTNFDEWQNDISEARTAFFYLNFFQAKQFGILDRFFKQVDDVSDDLILLLRFVNPSIKVHEGLRAFYDAPKVTTPKKSLLQLGSALQTIFKDVKYTERSIPGLDKVLELRHDSKVIPGNVFVAELESGSTKVINVLLDLYRHTTGSLPEPSQVVVCNANTTWEEVRLLLERCKALSQNNRERRTVLSQNIPESTLLYTLVNVERLPTKTQFKLVAEVKNMLKSNKRFLLALICCTGHHHHIIDQFSPNYTHLLDGCGLSDSEMRNFFTTGWPCLEGQLTTASNELYDDRVASMTLLTSTQTGLGKSEYVKRIASSIECSTISMHVSGFFSKDQLIKMVKELPKKKRCILHIDASQMEQKQLFDCFIFEIVVIGMAVSGTLMCASPSSVIILEVANTQGDVLRNALPICRAFPRKHLEWPGFDGFIVSEDIKSPVQVVCHYLKALDNKSLDTLDIQLVGDGRLTPLREDECRAILKRTFPIEDGISFTIVETFLRLFAQELQRMSVSIYFNTKNLQRMVKKQHTTDLRSNFVRKLQGVSEQFAARSVKMSLAKPSITPSAAATIHGLDSRPQSTVSADRMVSRMKDMVMWNDSNHLFMVFHRRDSQTFTPIYRDIKLVPGELLRTQVDDYDTMDYSRQSHDDLQLKLEMICRKSNLPFDRSKLEDLSSTYALTPDNFLKMVLIYLRIESKIPVVIMGETGCGKTTLVMYLARVCEIPFFKLNLHAGVTEERIASEMATWRRKAEEARGREIWVFLDEINTSNHLGLLNDVVCHHKWKGERLPANLVFIAACNPYRLRQAKPTSAGLRAKPKWERDEQSKLVYRVHPLPESMMDYVWDYGALNESDERAYIERMLGRNEYTFIELIVVSQKFLRKHEGNNHCVSLRDVNRCKHLKEYFMNKFFTSGKCPIHIPSFPRSHFVNRTDIRSMILGLCHCYHSRLIEADVRKRYRGAIAQELNRRQAQNVNADQIEQMMELEQMDLLDRMQLPSGIAKNEALRENVFVMLVSILNNIPVFVIGKPGCSKSLSMQLIKSNLRGPDSQNIYFKSLPPVYVISYQGSESSTSEGIIKVFDKAYNYKDHNPNVLPVVLLDEIGLAENSPLNPLRVLHSQLEPRVSDFPPIAVVGISNWELDSAKMNRAIHLSRPEPTEKDLKKTAVSIRDNIMTNKGENTQSTISDQRIQQLAEAYFNYQTAQNLTNFHGLRDYYNLIKYVATEAATKNKKRRVDEIVLQGLLRNFGGSKAYWEKILNTFSMTIPKSVSMVKVLDLITENIGDRNARHLMLITRGDLALNILEQHLQAMKPRRDYEIICGSKFSDDENEEYNYQILSEIILCMESGILLIMKDLEGIYESLYDMLNQNYTIVGKKKNCRVALGAHSNPMCQVHESFRCIVIVDEKKLDMSNPPFLNRFEKQFITMSEVMSDIPIEATKLLRQWTEKWTEVRDYEEDDEAVHSQFPKIFLGYNKDTLASLTYAHILDDKDGDGDGDDISDGIEDDPKTLAEICQNGLLKIACPDGVLKLQKSKMFTGDQSDALELHRKYFSLPLHRGFHHFYESEISTISNAQVIIYTHSSIHFDFKECLVGISCQVEKLSNFKSQQDLSSRIQEFWNSDDTLLILQCMPSLDMDAANMALAKCLLDQHRKTYLDNRRQSKETSPMKHMCIVVHFDRCQSGSTNQAWHFSFLCGWTQVTIDSLESTSPVLLDCLQNNMAEIFDSKSVRWQKVIDTNMLIWCFNCIRYTEFPRSVDSSLQLAYSIFQSDDIMTSFQGQIHRYLIWKDRQSNKSESDEWQTEVACNTELLMTCSTLVGAMLEHLKNEVRIPLAKTIIFLEENNSWSGSCPHVLTEGVRLDDTATSYIDEGNDMSENAREYWLKCFQDTALFDITSGDIEEPRGGETCTVSRSPVQLKYPFFMRFHQNIESHIQWLLEGTNTSLRYHDDHFNMQLCDLIKKNLSSLNCSKYLECHWEDFIYDLLNVFSERFAPNMCPATRVEVMKLLVVRPEVTSDKASDCFTCICDYYVYIWRNKKTISAELRLIAILDMTKVGIRRLIEQLQHLHKRGTPTYTSIDGFLSEAHAIQVSSEDVSNTDDDQIQHMPSEIKEGSPEKGGEVSADNIKQYDLMDTEEKVHATTVTEICREFLPTKRMLDDCGGLNRWQRTVNLVLLLTHYVVNETCILEGEMASDTSIVHFLGLCCDFARLATSLKWTNSDNAVSTLADLADETDLKDVLDNENVFEYIHQQLNDRSTPEPKKEEFLSLYFTFCLAANLDTPILRHTILECLVKRPETLPVGSRPVLLKILHNDLTAQTDKDPRGICEGVISTGEIGDDFPNISAIDEVLQGLDRESHFSIVCCDIIEDLAFKDLSWVEIRNINSGDCPLLATASKAIEIVFNAEDDEGNVPKSSMQYICCGSYLRAFAKATAKFFSNRKDPRLFLLGEKHYLLGNELNNMLCNTDDEAHPLLIYVLKCMRTYFTLADLVKWTKELPETIKFSQVLKFQEHLHTSRLGYNPLSYLPHYVHTINAVKAVLMEEDRDTARGKVDAIIDKAKSDIDQRLGMIAAFSEAFYWVKTTTGISDTAKEETVLLCERVKVIFQDSFGFLVQRLLTDSESRDPINITSTTDAVTLQKVSVILHTACLDIIWKKKFSRQLETAERVPRDSFQLYLRSDCVCGFSMLYAKNVPQNCVTCNRPFTDDQKVIKVPIETDDNGEQEFQMMIEAVSQVIHDSVHLFRLLQQGAEGQERNRLAETHASPNLGGTSNESLQDNEMKVYYEEEFQESWEKARKILDVDDDEIAVLFHTILHHVIKERKRAASVETACDAKIREVLMDLNRHQQKYLQDCLESQGIQRSHIEFQINELPYQQQDCNKERTKPRLLRQRIHPTFTEFKKGLLLKVETDETQFRFLQLYLRYKEALWYIRYLPTFLKWNSLITKRLGKTIERKQAEEQQIGSVLLEPNDTTNVQLFKEFQKAWNETCDGWETLTGSTSTFGPMSDSRRIKACLMDSSDGECPLFQMIRVLQDTQNRFLQNALSIASSTSSSSLNFLIRGDGIGVIQRVALDKARKEIIDFEWGDKLLQNYSDVGTEYGKGCIVSYNFIAIERFLARRLMMNKAILTDGVVFSHFPFSDELIHASSAILDDIDQHIKQTDLEEDTKTNIISKMTKQKNFANNLLANLEIMIVLLKKTGGDPEKPLEEYIKRWSTQLPGSFPRDILPECQVPITLSHVLALYRILEDHLADEYMETLESRFRKSDKKVFDRINSRMEGCDVGEMMSTARVIRLFAFRYLRPCSKVHVDTVNSRLMNIMKTSAGDSRTLELSALSPVISDDDDVKVHHIYKMQELIEEQIKEREAKQKQVQQQQQSNVQRVLPPETQEGTQPAAVRPKQARGTQRTRTRRVGKDPSSMT